MAYDALNRLKWKGGLPGCTIAILHRGAPGDEKLIPGRDITEIKKSHFMYSNGDRETYIPLHRVLRIMEGGKIIWERKRR